MRIFDKKLKLILFGFCMFFLGYFSINFIDLVNIKNRNRNIQTYSINNFPKSVKQINYDSFDESKKNISKTEIKTTPKRYIAYDGGGFGSINDGLIKCSDELEVQITDSIDDIKNIDILYFHMNAPEKIKYVGKKIKKQYLMVYTMESEVHSYGGESWSNADFRMWYNLEKSFPEPATYFDVKNHLIDLLSVPIVEFEQKETESSIVWVVSNCAAFNGREKFLKNLMTQIQIDSYGGCLKNKFTHPSEHMKGNIQLFSKYKFVIAIENSNCEDYITEKLVHAVASGSIPIVAGKNNKPNYSKFMPKNSFINIYDYKTVDDLVKHLKLIESDKNEYEKYIHFKRKHNYTREHLASLPLDELVTVAKTILNYENEKEFFDGLISKEKSENKLCKIARYLKNTPSGVIDAEINAKRMQRPSSHEICLKRTNLANDFNIS